MNIMTAHFKNIQITYPDTMSYEEALSYVNEELELNPTIKLKELEIQLNSQSDEVILTPKYDTINRVRRITGYLSNLPNFNDAKKAEEHDRIKHMQ